MYKFRAFAPVVIASALLAGPAPALADDERYDPTYSSIRLTSVTTDFDNLDSAVNLGFTIGINIPKINFLAAEIDLSSTLIPGENSGAAPVLGGGGGGNNCDSVSEALGQCSSGGGGGGSSGGGNNTTSSNDLRLNTVGIFAAARSPGEFFVSGRIGYRFMETTISELNEEQSGSAWGVGAGYRYSEKGLVELTYTQYGSDVRYLSLAVAY